MGGQKLTHSSQNSSSSYGNYHQQPAAEEAPETRALTPVLQLVNGANAYLAGTEDFDGFDEDDDDDEFRLGLGLAVEQLMDRIDQQAEEHTKQLTNTVEELTTTVDRQAEEQKKLTDTVEELTDTVEELKKLLIAHGIDVPQANEPHQPDPMLSGVNAVLITGQNPVPPLDIMHDVHVDQDLLIFPTTQWVCPRCGFPNADADYQCAFCEELNPNPGTSADIDGTADAGSSGSGQK